MKTDVFDNRTPQSLRPIFLMAISVVLLVSGCAGLSDTPSNAVIDDRRSTNSDRRNSGTPPSASPSAKANKTTSQTTTEPTPKKTAQTNQQTPSDADKSSSNTKKPPAADAAPAMDADPAGYYTVKEGDTLLKIAGQFNRMVSELTDWNTLTNPNTIKTGQVLRVAPPDNLQVMRIPVDPDMEIRRAGRPTQPPTSSQTTVRAAPSKKSTPSVEKIVYSDKEIADLDRPEPGPVRALDTNKKPVDTQPPGSSRFVWPTQGKVISTFDPTRKGIDIAGKAGQPVVAVSNGKVLYAKNMRGYGNLIIIEHGDNMVTAYAHNKTILVREGQTVTQSQQIAEMGDSDADSVKLRFQIRHMGKPVDPATLLPPAESP